LVTTLRYASAAAIRTRHNIGVGSVAVDFTTTGVFAAVVITALAETALACFVITLKVVVILR
jgi:hypothetical protein